MNIRKRITNHIISFVNLILTNIYLTVINSSQIIQLIEIEFNNQVDKNIDIN